MATNDRLVRLGLTPEQADFYRALLADEHANPAELARTTGTRDVSSLLDALLDLQLVAADHTRPAGVVPMSPAHALTRLARSRLDQIGEEMRAVADVHADIMALEALVATPPVAAAGDDPASREHLGRAAGARMQQLSLDARHSLHSVTPGASLDARIRPASLAANITSLRRGVSFRWIVQPDLLDDATLQPYLVTTIEAGAEIRMTRHEVTRVVVVDGATALVPLDASQHKLGALELTHPSAVSLLLMLFEQWWSRAVPIRIVDGRPHCWLGMLDDVDRVLLRLVADGATDAAMARRLSFSERQVRRRVAALTELMGARSRIHAAVQAERAGALWPDPADRDRPEQPVRPYGREGQNKIG